MRAPLILLLGLVPAAALWARPPGEPLPETVVTSRLGLELSGAAKVEGGVLLADDELVGAVTLVADPAKPRLELVKLYRAEERGGTRLFPFEDVEDLAADGDAVFVLGSHNPTRKGRRRGEREFLVRAKWSPKERKLLVSSKREPYRDLVKRIPKSLREGLNLEGLAVHAKQVYLGLRAPLDAKKRAVLLHTKAKHLFGKKAGEWEGDLERLSLDLGGQGVRALDWDPVSETLLVASGPPVDDPTASSRLWSYALKSKALTRVRSFPPERGVLEGVCRLNDRELLLGFDDDGKTGTLLRLTWPAPKPR